MKAVLRVWWTLFTAVKLQRVLCVIGAALFAFGVIGAPLSGNPAPFAIGFLAFAALVGTPALFAGPLIFRSLSAARRTPAGAWSRKARSRSTRPAMASGALPWRATPMVTRSPCSSAEQATHLEWR